MACFKKYCGFLCAVNLWHLSPYLLYGLALILNVAAISSLPYSPWHSCYILEIDFNNTFNGLLNGVLIENVSFLRLGIWTACYYENPQDQGLCSANITYPYELTITEGNSTHTIAKVWETSPLVVQGVFMLTPFPLLFEKYRKNPRYVEGLAIILTMIPLLYDFMLLKRFTNKLQTFGEVTQPGTAFYVIGTAILSLVLGALLRNFCFNKSTGGGGSSGPETMAVILGEAGKGLVDGLVAGRSCPHDNTNHNPSAPQNTNNNSQTTTDGPATSNTNNIRQIGPNTPAIDPKVKLKKIAEETMGALEAGSYSCPGPNQETVTYDLKPGISRTLEKTVFYAEDSQLKDWKFPTAVKNDIQRVSLRQSTTLEAASWFSKNGKRPIGILNFASATKPGGGFLNGANAQEESIARSSTLYKSLDQMRQDFYDKHTENTPAYSHAMIYSPDVTIFRDDDGNWIPPYDVDVVTSAAVNAKKARQMYEPGPDLEATIRGRMKERMARILHLFELQGVEYLVLGSFGTGVFGNTVKEVAKIWKGFLKKEFSKSFTEVMFAIPDEDTLKKFREVFNSPVASTSAG